MMPGYERGRRLIGSRMGEAALLSAAVVWGVSMPLMKSLLTQMDVVQILFVRFSLAVLLLSPLAWWYRRQYRISWLVPGIICGFAMCNAILLAVSSLLYTSATRAAFLMSMFIVLVPLTGRIFLGVRVESRVVWGAGFALAGSYCLTSMDQAQNLALNLGDLLAFLAALAASCHVHCVAYFGRKMPSFWLNYQQSFYVLLVSFVWCMLGDGVSLSLTPPGWVEMLCLAVLCTVFTFWATVWGQSRTESNRAVMFFSLEPVAAAVFAGILLGEVMGLWGFLGSGLIMGGVIIVALKPQARAEELKPGLQ
jgi:drug/metabolite transporter (DMT)-like permease